MRDIFRGGDGHYGGGGGGDGNGNAFPIVAAAQGRRRQHLNNGAGRGRDAQMASGDATIEIMVEQVKTVLPQVCFSLH